MAIITLNKCREIAAGKPDISSAAFRNAVGTVEAAWKRAGSQKRLDEILEIRAALLAHGAPVQKARPTKEELSAIRREASAKALVARSKMALKRKLAANRKGMTNISDRKPAIFDAALEMIEDREMLCLYAGTEEVYPGPAPEEGKIVYRRITIAALDAALSGWMSERPCPWMSRRNQAQEDRV